MAGPAIAAPNPATDKPPRRRRRVPVSVRVLVVSQLVLFSVGGWLKIGVPVYRNHTAIAAIHRLQGACNTRDGILPAWLQRRFGDRRLRTFEEVYIVNLWATPVADDDLAKLEGLTGLERLDLGQTAISDAGLVHLRKLTALTHLSLAYTQVTDEGLAHLQGLPHLHELNLEGTRVTDAALRRALPRWLDGDGDKDEDAVTGGVSPTDE